MSYYKTHQEYRDAWESAYQVDPPVPLNIDLEIASLCNLRCPFCFIPDPKFEEFISQKSDDGKSLRRIMPIELAFKIIYEAAKIGVPALKMNWRGESTISPNYSDIVQYARNLGWAKSSRKIFDAESEEIVSIAERPVFLEILANTNANCPDKAIDGLMACTKVMVSLDSMVPETYAQMRVGGKLQRAKEVISELVRRGHPNLWVRRVLTKLNYREKFFEQVKEQWGDRVHVSQHFCFDRNAKNSSEITGCDHDENTKRKYCGYPSQRLVITSRGLVYPCCIDLHETLPVGDITKQSLLEIWNGEPIKRLRKELRSLDVGMWHKTCINCESWMSHDAPQRDFVQDRELVQGMEMKLA